MYIGKNTVNLRLFKTRDILVEAFRRYKCDLVPVGNPRKPRAYYCLCPFHNERTPSVRIDTHKNELQKGEAFFKCFGCGRAGDVFRLVEMIERVHFAIALRIVQKSEYAATLLAVNDPRQLKFPFPGCEKAPQRQFAEEEENDLLF